MYERQANKHMKKCLATLVIREMQLNSQLDANTYPLEWAKIFLIF